MIAFDEKIRSYQRRLHLKIEYWRYKYGLNEEEFIKAFEMWCYWCMQIVNWVNRVTNNEVLQQLNEQRIMIPTIKTK